MKTIEKIQAQIDEIVNHYGNLKPKRKVLTEVAFKRSVIDYLRTQPTEIFIKYQIDKLEARIKSIEDNIPYPDSTNPDVQKINNAWLSENGYQKLKDQLYFLNYAYND